MSLDAFGLHVGDRPPHARCRTLLGPFDRLINGSRYAWCVKREPHGAGTGQAGNSAVGCTWSTSHDRPDDLADWIRDRTARLHAPGAFGQSRPVRPDDPPN